MEFHIKPYMVKVFTPKPKEKSRGCAGQFLNYNTVLILISIAHSSTFMFPNSGTRREEKQTESPQRTLIRLAKWYPLHERQISWQIMTLKHFCLEVWALITYWPQEAEQEPLNDQPFIYKSQITLRVRNTRIQDTTPLAVFRRLKAFTLITNTQR